MLSLPDVLPVKSVTDLQRQALLPVNQAAALKLIQAGVAIENGLQPIFQLMEWAASSDKHDRFRDITSEIYSLKTSPDQVGALGYLFANAPGGMRDAARTILRRTPRSAARMLLDLLDIRIKSDPKKF